MHHKKHRRKPRQAAAAGSSSWKDRRNKRIEKRIKGKKNRRISRQELCIAFATLAMICRPL
jgi:hypothetical protein